MYYVVFILSVSIIMPDGRSGYKEILDTPKLEYCLNEAKHYIELLSRPDYTRQIKEATVECKKVIRHDV